MKLGWLAVGWLSLACAAAGEGAAPAEVPHDLGVVAPTILVPADLIADVGAAVALWAEASGGKYQPTLTSGPADIRVELAADMTCGALHEGLSGCYEQGLLRISATTARDTRVATIVHELGHSLGLADEASGLMNPHRNRAERLAPCVSAQNVADVGWVGPGACL